MRSMTGFGTGESPLGLGKIVVEVRTVNARFLDIRTRLPPPIADCAMFLEQLVRARLVRGRCEVQLRLEGAALPPVALDVAKARAAFAAIARLRDELAPGADIPLALLSAVPELFVSSADAATSTIREALEHSVSSALDGLDAMRSREGAALVTDFRARIAALRGFVDATEARHPEVLAGHRRRLGERLRSLMDHAPIDPDGARLEQELVFYLDRTDITEELTRLKIHLGGLGEMLDCAESCGRKIDFLLQEVSREVNTIGAKSQDALVSRAVVDAKAEVERFREQVQNVE